MSKVYRIDLNKLRVLDRAHARAARTVRVLVGLYVVAVVFLLVVSISALSRMNDHVARRRAAVAAVRGQLAELTRAENYVSRDEVMSLVRLERERLLWTGHLVRLCADVPEGVAVTRLSFKGGRLELEGIARIAPGRNEFDLVRSFINVLNADSLLMRGFRPVQFESTTRLDIKDMSVLKFDLTSMPILIVPAEGEPPSPPATASAAGGSS